MDENQVDTDAGQDQDNGEVIQAISTINETLEKIQEHVAQSAKPESTDYHERNGQLYSTDTGKGILSKKVTDFLQTCRENGDYVTPHAFARLEEYIIKMTDDPKNEIITERAGILQQLELLRSITQLFTQTPTNVFRRAYGHYLDVIRENIDGAFSTTMVARFLDHDLMDADAKQTFVKLINLLIKTCRSDRVNVAKQVDIPRSLQSLGEEAIARATNFYRK